MEDVFNKEESPSVITDDSRALEAEVYELLSMFNTGQISQEEVGRECELVREELYNAQFVGTCSDLRCRRSHYRRQRPS